MIFTDEDTTNMPKLEGPPTSAMDNIEITQSSKTELLSEFKADKAPGPDKFPSFQMLPRRYLLFDRYFQTLYPDLEITRRVGRG